MNFPSNRYRVELVGSADSGDLLEILEQEEFPGAISLLYTRRPDPFRSLNKDGEEVHIVGVREMSSGSIIGFGACSINTLYINGQATPVAYLSTLRLRKEFRNQRVPLIQCYRRMLDIISERNIHTVYTTILEDNQTAQQFLEKNRPSMPQYRRLGGYEVAVIKTSKKKPPASPFTSRFGDASRDDVDTLLRLFSDTGAFQNLFPVITRTQLVSTESTLHIRNFLLLFDSDGTLVASGLPWNQQSYKQYVVQAYSGNMLRLRLLSKLFPFFGYPSLPAEGSILDFHTLSFWCVKNNDPSIARGLIQHCAYTTRSHAYFLVGIASDNHLAAGIKKFPHILYRSIIYQVFDRKFSPMEPPTLNAQSLYLECGRL